MPEQGQSIDTQLIHAGEIRPGIEGAVELPIFQSANFESVDGEEYHDIKYMRLSNSPNHTVLAEKLAALESADAALVATSGMAAITTVFHSLLAAGDHVIFQDCLYGGTYDYARREFARHGLSDLPAILVDNRRDDVAGPVVIDLHDKLAQVGLDGTHADRLERIVEVNLLARHALGLDGQLGAVGGGDVADDPAGRIGVHREVHAL